MDCHVNVNQLELDAFTIYEDALEASTLLLIASADMFYIN